LPNIKGYKSEARNPKSETILNDQNSNVPNHAVLDVATMILFLRFGHLVFEFVSYFGIRISNFAMAPAQTMPSGRTSKPGPLDPVFYWVIPETR
jgi:hypothetical protein